MDRDVSRRRFLRATTACSVGAVGVFGVADRARAGSAPRSFDPAVHGFDFANWAPGDGRFPDHDHFSLSPSNVEKVIADRWDTPFSKALGVGIDTLPDSLVEAIARQVYVSTVQASASNGHCWGMGFTAQHYFEHPDAVPAGRESASEFTHPMAPLSDPDSYPVSDDIDGYQLYQVLSANAWIGRRGILNPGWIQLDKQVRNVESAVEEFGTATITLVDPADRNSHIVLAYDVRRRNGATEIAFYDPNRRARRYQGGFRTRLRITSGADGLEMEPYTRYRTFLYNDRQRLIASRGEAAAAPAFGAGPSTLRNRLLSVAVFLLDTEDARLTVVDPDGTPVTRDWATFATREASTYCQMRYRYDPPAGRYHVVVTGRRDTDFTLSVLAADEVGQLVRERHEGAVEAGGTASFAVDVPESGADSGSFEATTSLPDWLLAGGGLALGAVGSAAASRYR